MAGPILYQICVFYDEKPCLLPEKTCDEKPANPLKKERRSESDILLVDDHIRIFFFRYHQFPGAVRKERLDV
jgi:hypothetical protein